MLLELNEKEVALISLVLSTCKVIMKDSNKHEVDKLIKKLNLRDS